MLLHLHRVLPRLAPAPSADTPYDEEYPRSRVSHVDSYVQGALALAFEEPEPQPVPQPVPQEPMVPGERWLRMFGQAFAEVLAGQRPARAIAAHVTPRTYAEILRAGRILDIEGPPFAAAPHVGVPIPGVIEMCLLIHGGARSRVLALRLERRGTQWLCTDFETTP